MMGPAHVLDADGQMADFTGGSLLLPDSLERAPARLHCQGKHTLPHGLVPVWRLFDKC